LLHELGGGDLQMIFSMKDNGAPEILENNRIRALSRATIDWRCACEAGGDS
jgi:hypothetical protein